MSDLDEALEQFQRRALEYAGGLANHGPMAAEALAVLGHAALIPGWVDVYAARLPPLEKGRAISPEERDGALGDPARLGDWVATFDREILERPWREVLSTWAGKLLPGLFAGAAHGWLRVAHGVRALDEAETAGRRREIALGLAYWAGRYQPLPGRPSARPLRGRDVAACFEAVPVVDPPARRPGFFFDAVKRLDEVPAFARVVESFDPDSASLDAQLHEMARAGARLYLENPSQRVAYAHCVTAPSALRLLAGVLPPDVAGRAAGHALQASLALHAVSARPEPARDPDAETMRLAESPAELRYRAACSLEEHAIKLCEACLREDALRPDPVFRLAAADAALHLDGGAGRGAVARDR